jgi:hypothetical protein
MEWDPCVGSTPLCLGVVSLLCSVSVLIISQILPVTSACCGAVVRNECREHFSFIIVYLMKIL